MDNDLASRRTTHERNETISRLGSQAQTPPNLRFSLDHFTRKLQAALLPTTHCGHKQPALKENKTIRKPGTAEHQLWWFLCPSLVFWVLTLSFFSFFFFLSEPPRFEVQLQCAVFIMEVL